MEHVFDALQDMAMRQPGSIALASRGGHMNFRDLAGNIASVASAAAKNGVKPGQLVVVAVANLDAQLIVALALMRLGCRVGYSRIVGHYDSCGVAVDAVIVDAPMPGLKHRVIAIGRDWFKGAEGSKLSLPAPAAECSIIFSSSGSTGSPKLIEFDHAALRYRVLSRVSDPFLQDRARFLSVFGHTTAPAFQDHLVALINGGMVIRAADRQGASILDAIELFCPSYVLITPSTLLGLVQAIEEVPRTIAKVQWLRVGGAYCSPVLQQAALDLITEDIISFYGATEIGRVALGYFGDVTKVDRSVGRIVDEMEVATFDTQGRKLPPGTEGEIRVKGPEGTAGTYLGDISPHQPVFRDGWFVTGDIGLVDKERNLIIRGRSSNVINIGGSKVSPEVLEDDIRAFSQVRDVGVSGVDLPEGFQEICAAIVTRSKLSLDDINAHLLRRKARWPLHQMKIVPAIPKTESGKIDRVALRRLCSSQA